MTRPFVNSIDRSLLRSERDTLSIDLEDDRSVSVPIEGYQRMISRCRSANRAKQMLVINRL